MALNRSSNSQKIASRRGWTRAVHYGAAFQPAHPRRDLFTRQALALPRCRPDRWAAGQYRFVQTAHAAADLVRAAEHSFKLL